ncbi:hypothetical protein M433DRAFT_21842 [Acidomyces richmondensis BFW]|nr:MAG: hypothetical protein FE78DRAFT_535190 [Acidomyces sp. 'richmondensis']KYG48864.1 hypothetical protein M433DRAFT_21842 [Acidomyces richmondensis BFW]
MGSTFRPAFPWLLYAYPWMPYPRRVIIYLREKCIPTSLVTIVRVRDPEMGNDVVNSELYPPRPSGSLPVLAIPNNDGEGRGSTQSYTYIRQSMAIISYLEEICNSNQLGFSAPHGSLFGEDALARARVVELTTLAEELTASWNPVRTFGTKAGTILIPEASKEMLRWIRRTLHAIETMFTEDKRDMAKLRRDIYGHANIGDILLYQFLDFTKVEYGVDMTNGSGEMVKDVYGRTVKEDYPKLREFYTAFSTRRSAERHAELGEEAPEFYRNNMQAWANDVW